MCGAPTGSMENNAAVIAQILGHLEVPAARDGPAPAAAASSPRDDLPTLPSPHSNGVVAAHRLPLEAENAKLKRMYAELALENAAIKGVLSRKP